MYRKYLKINICLLIILLSIGCVSAMDDVNKTDDLGISLDTNIDSPEIFNETNNEVNIENNANLESNSNILSMSNDDIMGNTITPTAFTFAAIQTAVDSASDGDTISLQEGTYLNKNNAPITISKNLSFVGVKDKTILDAQKKIKNI